MKISILVPCYNEEKSIEASIQSCLAQTRPFDEIVFIDDCSKDRTNEILTRYSDRLTFYRTPKNTGNKSSAQEFGLQFITGDVFVTTDGDTLLDPNFCREIERVYEQYPDTCAVAGYVKSLPYNWLTLCRAFEYSIGQNIHKRAQNYIKYIFVMPGAASSFRTDAFRKFICFDHDTITEDLDFTYKLHQNNQSIRFCPTAICYTQDPATLHGYINQMRRWFGGGWQNLLKHYSIIITKPMRSLELSLLYTEGVLFSFLLFILPFLNIVLWFKAMVSYLIVSSVLAVYTAIVEKRWKLSFVAFPYLFLMYVNAYVYLEQFFVEMVMKRKNLVWFQPDRVEIKAQHQPES
jgi:poly-beta-1,6-N-acetyl-D-glucosamine synthase